MKTIQIKHAPELSQQAAEQLFLFLAELTDAIFTHYHDQILANEPGAPPQNNAAVPPADLLQIPDHIIEHDRMWRDMEDLNELEPS